jgi:hypothetical protein
MPLPLDRKVKTLDALTYTGETALRLLMAADTPGIDLLVRESIQNSLDASVQAIGSVSVEFKYAQFHAKTLRGILDDETVDGLSRIHPGTSTSLYVRDVGTVGLSGPPLLRTLSQDDREGNYLKLCFSMGAAQDQEGAGGSWGFGKTVFFRACHAPVMFYSRFKEGNDYRERLIFYIIEDPGQEDALTRRKVAPASTGFAWWGVASNENDILPCESDAEITDILCRLGNIPRFAGEETGTLIFMPCLRREGQMPAVLDPSENAPYWISRNPSPTIKDFEEYTKVTIQRWYATRIDNPSFADGEKPYLIAKVGSEEVGSAGDPMLPLPRLMRHLYDVATGMKVNDQVIVNEIKLQNTFINGSSAGKLAAIRVAPDDPILGMTPPENYPTPIVQAGGYEFNDQSGTQPILAMTRKPGMIVAYENHGDWVQSINPDPEGHHLIALFILRSDALMTDRYRSSTLEEEVRLNEPAAHDRWLSGTGCGGERLRLVENIRLGVQKAINRHFYPTKPPETVERDSNMATIVGDRLLPLGFGVDADPPLIHQIWTCPNHPEIRLSAPGTCPLCHAKLILFVRDIPVRGKLPQISILQQSFLPNGLIEIDIQLYNGEATSVEVSLNAATEGSHISVREWGNEIQTVFPFELLSGRVYAYKRGVGVGRQLSWADKDLVFTAPNENNTDPEVRVLSPHGAGGSCHHLIFEITPMKSRIKCRLHIRMYSSEVMPILIAKQIAP